MSEKIKEKVKVRVKIDESVNTFEMPAIALRGLVVFPNNVIQFEVGRERSIAAIEWAMENTSNLFLVTQKDMDCEKPERDDLYTYGVIAEVKQVLRISDKVIKVLVEGKQRAKIVDVSMGNDYLEAIVKRMPLRGTKTVNTDQIEALKRSLKDNFQRYMILMPRLPKEIAYNILTSEDPKFLSEYVPSNILFKYDDKQLVLNESTLIGRLERIITLLTKENTIISLEKEIQDKVNAQMEKNQREYYLREQMRAINEELDDGDDTRREAEKYKERLSALNLVEETNEKIYSEIERLRKMQSNSQEATVIRTYLDIVLNLPWNDSTSDNLDIKRASTVLNKDHYGMDKVKERILEILSVRKLSNDTKGQIICLVGPPGVGKTSIASSIAKCLGRKYARMSLGGVRDESEIRGHRRTYIGAMPGKIISAIQSTKSKNPLILMDEIDKMGNDFRGDPASALLETLDPEQNNTFKDHYLDVDFDLSEVLFITTANTLDTIPRPLLDRMEIIQLSSYTRVEKFNIAKKHLIPKQLDKTGLKDKVKFTNSAVYMLIDSYTGEAGVRGLEHVIAEVLRKCAKQIASGDVESISVSIDNVETLIGPKRKKPSFFSNKDTVGIANGLAWTSIGGEILPIEVEIIEKGTGKIEVTGSLGDVMKESAKLAVTYAKVHASEFGYEADVFKNIDIHIHAPEGAIPKDGPSAGITLTTALISALSNIKVRGDVAMTGEITLHGLVLPIGGLKEKSMAAYREGMKTVLIPYDNISDLYEVDKEVKDNVEFVPVKTLNEAFAYNLMRDKAKSHKVLPVKKESVKTSVTVQ